MCPCNGMESKVSSETEPATSAPNTDNIPGWQILQRAAIDMTEFAELVHTQPGMSPSWHDLLDGCGTVPTCAKAVAYTLMINLVAREKEIIPREHLEEVVDAIIKAASTFSPEKCPIPFVAFLRSHKTPNGQKFLEKYDQKFVEEHGYTSE